MAGCIPNKFFAASLFYFSVSLNADRFMLAQIIKREGCALNDFL